MNKTAFEQNYQQEMQKIVEAIKTKYKPKKIIAFGSSAYGNADEDSDIDLLVIKDDPRRFIDRVGDVANMFEHILPVDILVYTPEEINTLKKWNDPFIKSVLSEGKTLHG